LLLQPAVRLPRRCPFYCPCMVERHPSLFTFICAFADFRAPGDDVRTTLAKTIRPPAVGDFFFFRGWPARALYSFADDLCPFCFSPPPPPGPPSSSTPPWVADCRRDPPDDERYLRIWVRCEAGNGADVSGLDHCPRPSPRTTHAAADIMFVASKLNQFIPSNAPGPSAVPVHNT